MGRVYNEGEQPAKLAVLKGGTPSEPLPPRLLSDFEFENPMERGERFWRPWGVSGESLVYCFVCDLTVENFALVSRTSGERAFGRAVIGDPSMLVNFGSGSGYVFWINGEKAVDLDKGKLAALILGVGKVIVVLTVESHDAGRHVSPGILGDPLNSQDVLLSGRLARGEVPDDEAVLALTEALDWEYRDL